ncbi:hypothetical protein CANMA_004646 [Candida margitis]|uniref:uncharacterized protein n=1 Tax=Candida margitis TaxID=1775924 RepID=UPI002226D982|nr:uncharacterized protein CANMA_004646 [Candida margitis]KAI5953808.1 hypothetical protein CANMA_004646 [Candida margitis]
MDSSDAVRIMKNASPSMNPISPTTLDNLSMDLRERKYRTGPIIDDELASPTPSIGPKTPRLNRGFPEFSSPGVGSSAYTYSQSLQRQHSPRKSIISPSKNYSESVTRLRAARGSPMKSPQKAVDEERYKWSQRAQIDSLKDENTKLHRELEKADYYRKETLRLQKELDKAQIMKAEYGQLQKNADRWQMENERFKVENSRLKSTLEIKEAKITQLHSEVGKLSKVQKEQKHTIDKKNSRIMCLEKSLDLALAYCTKWEGYIDKYVAKIAELKRDISYLKSAQEKQDFHNSNRGSHGEFSDKSIQTDATRDKKKRNEDKSVYGTSNNINRGAYEEVNSRVQNSPPISAFQDSSGDFVASIAEKVSEIVLSRMNHKEVSDTPHGMDKSLQSQNKSHNLNAQDLADDNSASSFVQPRSASTATNKESLRDINRSQETTQDEIGHEKIKQPPNSDNIPSLVQDLRKDFNHLLSALSTQIGEVSRENSSKSPRLDNPDSDPILKPQTHFRKSSPARQCPEPVYRPAASQDQAEPHFESLNIRSQSRPYQNQSSHHHSQSNAQTQTCPNDFVKERDNRYNTLLATGDDSSGVQVNTSHGGLGGSSQASLPLPFTTGVQVGCTEGHYPETNNKQEASHIVTSKDVPGESSRKHPYFCLGPDNLETRDKCPVCHAEREYTDSNLAAEILQ